MLIRSGLRPAEASSAVGQAVAGTIAMNARAWLTRCKQQYNARNRNYIDLKIISG